MKRALLAGLLVFTMIISGCWDRREINDLLLVVAYGIDLAGTAGEKRIVFTSQISAPMAQGLGGGAEGPKAKAFWTVSETGPTVRAGVMETLGRVPKPLFFGQSRVVVIGSKAAQYGLPPILDRLLRSRESRRTVFVAITKGEAQKILEMEMPSNQASGIGLSSMFDLKGGTEDVMSVTLNDLAYILSTGMTSPVAPVVSVVPQNSVTTQDRKTPETPLETLVVSGLAVFSPDGRLLDFFNKEETMGLMLVRNKTKNRLVNVSSPVGGPEETVSLGLVKSESKIKASIDETGLPSYEIKVSSLYDVSEDFGNLKGMDEPEYFDKLALNASREIEKEVMAAVQKAQALNTDVFGFGEEFRRQHLKAWAQIKDQWKQVFPSVKVTVKCDAGLRHRGQIIKSPGGFRES
ncbi:MAG: Ger(x)C family spore germination protein [Firmicutes bacterium]|nr:Ger(x)C family spore germination protein [Bacillota bacterium]